VKRFKGFIRKEFYHIFRDPRSLIILFGMPLIQILLFGYVITNEIKDAKIGILDHSKDEMSNKLVHKLLSSEYFKLHAFLSEQDQIEEIFRKGKIKLIIIIEPNFSTNLEKENSARVQILADASDPNEANLLSNYARGIIQDFVLNINNKAHIVFKTDIQSRMLFNPELKGVFMFVPGIIAMLLILISALMTSVSITREKELGTMEVLLASPLKPLQIIAGKVVPYIFISFMITVSILLLGYFVFGVPVRGSIVLLLSEALLYIIMALSMGIFISTISNSQQVAMMLSMFALMLPTILLSGFIFPIENMPELLQYFSYIIPPKWFIIIIKNIMLKGTSLAFVWKETLIIIAMTLVFILLSVKNFKIRLE
jgi:ABC-2 type transport system permease protein